MFIKLLIGGILFISITIAENLFGQAECNETFAYIFGSPGIDEKGYSLAASDKQQAIYAAGIKGDSAIIVKISYSGKIEWIRAFDFDPDQQDHITRILVDSDDMIVAAGIAGSTDVGGSIFVFRYNPVSNTLLWSSQISNPNNNFCDALIQKGPNGNYLLFNNPQSPNNLMELIEINKNNGTVNTQLSKHYNLGGPENMDDALYFNGKIYATGRFSINADPGSFRNTLLRLDGNSGNIEWVKLGHKGENDEARLYGISLVLDQNNIYSVYCGDDEGSSLTESHIFVQKTTEAGALVWVKEYDIPGVNDWADEIIKSNNGFVTMCRSRTSPSDIILFKIDENGNVLWSRKFDYSINDNSIPIGSVQAELIEADQHLYFTAISGDGISTDMIIVKTDLNGNISDTCSVTTTLNLTAKNIMQTSWFPVQPDVTDFTPDIAILQPVVVKPTSMQKHIICQLSNSLTSSIEASICLGDIFDGYSQPGQYIDHFVSHDGCDSIRMLNLSVTNSILTTKDVVLCGGGTFEGYSQSGIYTDTFISHFGCDSLRTLNLVIGQPISTTINTTICDKNLFGHESIGTYVDTLLANDGCDSIRTLIVEGASKYIPNVFSPNNDGINDFFKVIQFPDPSLALRYFAIFDRSGNMTYQTDEWPVEWNGKGKNGEAYNPGVFSYILIYFCGEKKVTEIGAITVVR